MDLGFKLATGVLVRILIVKSRAGQVRKLKNINT